MPATSPPHRQGIRPGKRRSPHRRQAKERPATGCTTPIRAQQRQVTVVMSTRTLQEQYAEYGQIAAAMTTVLPGDRRSVEEVTWALRTLEDRRGREVVQRAAPAISCAIKVVSAWVWEDTYPAALRPLEDVGPWSLPGPARLAVNPATWPRPKGDNGQGLHWFPTTGQSRQVVDRFVPELLAMRIKWVVFLNGIDDDDLGANDYLVQQLTRYDIEPVLRVEARVGPLDLRQMTLRILFVEKDATTADLLVPSLERKGYEVAVARTQRQATSRILSFRPHLLVVDVASFGSNGYEVSDAVRARLERAPTILLLEKGHTGGTAEAFMTPPFTSRKLLYRVKKMAGEVTRREIRLGALALDLDTNTLRKGSETLQLRPKEAALLALFMHNPGKVLSRQEIIKQVWETEYLGDTRTLTVHVRWVREKIEDDPGAPRFLRTVRGVGYRFEVA
jgi:DNA-binding response OmpR family regulator